MQLTNKVDNEKNALSKVKGVTQDDTGIRID